MKSKKLLSVFLSLVLMLGCLSAAVLAQAEDLIEINNVNFPDPVWRAYILERYDTGAEEGYLTAEERNSVTEMQIWISDEIADLKGIEYFTSLTKLRASTIGLQKLDVSALSKLTTLSVQGNELTSLDVSKNEMLEELVCWGNEQLSSLTVGKGIKKLLCEDCNLTSLDVSQCTNLTELICRYNHLTSLNLLNNPNLVSFNCAYNNLTSLDLRNCTQLTDFSSYNTQGQTTASKVHWDETGFRAPITIESGDRISYSNIVNPNADIYDTDDENAPVWTGYNTNMRAFEFLDYGMFDTGIVYSYDLGLEGIEDMEVTVTLEKDFYRVRYFNGEEVISTQYINSGSDGIEQELPEAPENMICGSWSDNAENITADRDIYARWASEHSEDILSFVDDVAEVRCTACKEERSLPFKDSLNSSEGEENYRRTLDVNHDGAINVRDYSKLIKMY